MSTILDQIVHIRTVALKKYDVTCVLYCILHKAKNFSFGLYCSKKCQFTYHKQYPNAIRELKIIERVKKLQESVVIQKIQISHKHRKNLEK